MNKFDALKMFQGWPPEWQRLCAECWIETGGVEPATPCDIEARFRNGEPVSRQVIQCNADAIPFAQHKAVLTYPREAAKVAAAKPIRNCMAYTSEELSEVDSHLVRGLGPTEVAKIMMRKYKGHRTKESWRKMAQMAQYIRKRSSLAAADRAIELEGE